MHSEFTIQHPISDLITQIKCFNALIDLPRVIVHLQQFRSSRATTQGEKRSLKVTWSRGRWILVYFEIVGTGGRRSQLRLRRKMIEDAVRRDDLRRDLRSDLRSFCNTAMNNNRQVSIPYIKFLHPINRPLQLRHRMPCGGRLQTKLRTSLGATSLAG